MFLKAIVLIGAVLATALADRTMKDRLFDDLMDDYESAMDPGNIDLKMKLTLLCAERDRATGHIVTQGWEYLTWKDERLKWTPASHGGIQSLRVPTKYIWTPDMRLYNTMMPRVERADVNTVLYSNGLVMWISPVMYKTFCTEENSEYTCNYRIGSWGYDGNNLKLAMDSTEGIDLEPYFDACPLVVSNHTASVQTKYYPCCTEPYSSFEATVVYKQNE